MSRHRTRDRHLPACVYPKHGAYYLVKRGKWTRLGANLHDALEEYARMHEAPQGTMAALIDEALAEIMTRVKPSTQKQYRMAARKLKVYFQAFRPEQVRPKHVAQLKVKLSHRPNLANLLISVLRQVFHFALEEQRVDTNPAVGVRRHKERKRRRLHTRAEFDAIYAKAGPQLQVIMDLLIRTAQRINDVLAIRRSDLGKKGISFEQQKTGARRIVRWTPELRAVVKRAKSLHGNLRALTLLHTRRGKPISYSTVLAQWRKACAEAGVEDSHIHDLRAFALSAARRQGKNAKDLAGHTSEQQTARYLRDREALIVDGPEFAAGGPK